MKKIGNLLGLFVLFAVIFSACKSEITPTPEPEEAKPTADFTFEQVDESDPFTFAFKNESAKFKEVRWEFGDDSSSLEVSPVHTFLYTGTFRVKMRTLNGQGNWAQMEAVVKIIPKDIFGMEATQLGDGSLDLTLNSEGHTVDSLFWFKGKGAAAVRIGEGEKINISVESGLFEDYTVRIQTPKGSKAEISNLFTQTGIVRDITNDGRFDVSRDNPSGAESGEGSLKLINGNYRDKFLLFDFNGSPGDVWFKLSYFQPVIANAFTFTSANDAPGRDPKDFNLEGSNNGDDWTVIYTHTGETFATRYLTKIFRIENSTPYNYYRMNVTAVGSGSLIQIGEWRLLQFPPE